MTFVPDIKNVDLPTAVSSRPMNQEASGFPWFALNVKSRYERMAAKFLESRGYQSFLPMYKSRRCWSDRVKELDVPLFPGYLFCRFNIHNRLPVLVVPGVLGIVGGTKLPSPIDLAEIDALQAAVRGGLSREPWPFLHVGDRVRIEHGSLAGVEGILLQVKGRHRLILSVTLLQRSVAVDVDSAWVSTLESRPRIQPASLRPVHTAA